VNRVAFPGDDDIADTAAEIADRLPGPLQPLATVAYNYRWSWAPDGPAVFAAIDAQRWARSGRNPVRMLWHTPRRVLDQAAGDAELTARIEALAEVVADDLARPASAGPASSDHPIAFMCAEFGIHESLPIYSGGLGVLAGDILKEASDLAVPMVGVGLLYRTGYFHQRIDTTGLQHEYWVDADPDLLPCVRLTGGDGRQVTVTVPVGDEDLDVAVWRVDVGRVPLLLLDSSLPTNSIVGRWATSRLYEGNAAVRLAQYAVLGVGGIRALRALGVDPSVHHLNEGHPALASVALTAERIEAGASWDDAWAEVRRRLVFTTHTPVPAGNETYHADDLVRTLGRVADLTGDRDRFLALGRIHSDDSDGGMTALALRASRAANAVSRRHGEVAREMWRPVFAAAPEVPITHVTNGVHVPSWLCGPMRRLLDQHLGPGWPGRADDPATWDPVDGISDRELWDARTAARSELVDFVRQRATLDRLRRGEDIDYAAAAERGFDADRLTIGFARRLAAYKRLYLLSLRPERALRLLTGSAPAQFLVAGKAHPLDDGAKAILRRLFEFKGVPEVADKVAFLEDYDLSLARPIVGGCDVWINVPRPPEEASGTSGMKAALNGALNVSVLDGWWAEGYDGSNGWAIEGEPDPDHAGQDQRHADALFDLLEHQVVPLFADRDDEGLPRAWLAMVRDSIRTNGPRFSATRMVREYLDRIY
jgi:starch phosphorylase